MRIKAVKKQLLPIDWELLMADPVLLRDLLPVAGFLSATHKE